MSVREDEWGLWHLRVTIRRWNHLIVSWRRHRDRSRQTFLGTCAQVFAAHYGGL